MSTIELDYTAAREQWRDIQNRKVDSTTHETFVSFPAALWDTAGALITMALRDFTDVPGLPAYTRWSRWTLPIEGMHFSRMMPAARKVNGTYQETAGRHVPYLTDQELCQKVRAALVAVGIPEHWADAVNVGTAGYGWVRDRLAEGHAAAPQPANLAAAASRRTASRPPAPAPVAPAPAPVMLPAPVVASAPVAPPAPLPAPVAVPAMPNGLDRLTARLTAVDADLARLTDERVSLVAAIAEAERLARDAAITAASLRTLAEAPVDTQAFVASLLASPEVLAAVREAVARSGETPATPARKRAPKATTPA